MLLLAPDLLGESLALKLTSARGDWEVVLRPERLTGAPALVIWSIDTVASLASLQQELFALQERWQPAPVLLLLPSELRLSREQLLELPAAGLLQNVDAQGLQNTIEILLQATHQQPLAQTHGLLLAWRRRRSLQANVPSALQQGFDGVLQALGINVLQQAGRGQLQQLLPRQA